MVGSLELLVAACVELSDVVELVFVPEVDWAAAIADTASDAMSRAPQAKRSASGLMARSLGVLVPVIVLPPFFSSEERLFFAVHRQRRRYTT